MSATAAAGDGVPETLSRLVRRAQGDHPDQVVETLAASVAELGGTDVALYLVDYEHRHLVPYPDALPHAEPPVAVPIESTDVGRAFSLCETLATPAEGGWHVWVPVTERADRVGVLAMTLPTWDESVEASCAELGLTAALLITAARNYTDVFHLLRRRRGMSLAAEMQWSLLPPLACRADGATVTGMLEPAYSVGGDCFDYAVNGTRLDVALFDAVGHGLSSAVLASLLIGAYRNARRSGAELQELATTIDEVARSHCGDWPYATAAIATLDTDTGRLSWMVCGHPRPLHVRGTDLLAPVGSSSSAPLGMGGMLPVTGEVVTVDLEPGDGVLFYTDGIIDALSTDGRPAGEARLGELLTLEHDTGRHPAEVLRRLMAATVTAMEAPLRDDATGVYLTWAGPDS